MRIMQVIPLLYGGGAETFVRELSMALSKKGHAVSIVNFYRDEGKNTLSDEIYHKLLLKKDGADISLFFKLLLFIIKEKPDVVHAHVGAIKYIFLATLFYKRARFVVTIHSEAKREAGSFWESFFRKVMFKYRLCEPITISEESEKSFYEYYGKHARIILNGVSDYEKDISVQLFNRDRYKYIFIHPASCQPIKNQKLLFEAFSRLSKIYPDVKLYWMGSVTHNILLFEDLKTYFSDNIEYIGVKNNVRDYLAQADGMCLSSLMEGLPMVIIESFSVGCPVFCTPVGGCNNVVNNGINGFLSSDMSIESYYEMLKSFISLNENQKAQLKQTTINSFKFYTISNTADSYIKIYKK